MRWATTSAIRLVLQEGQTPRPLQLKATSRSWPQASQRAMGETVSQDSAEEVGSEIALHPEGEAGYPERLDRPVPAPHVGAAPG